MTDVDHFQAYERAAKRIGWNAGESVGLTPLRRKIFRAYFLVMLAGCLCAPLRTMGPAIYGLGGAVIGFIVMIAFLSAPSILHSPIITPAMRHLRTFPISHRAAFWIQLRQGFTGMTFILKLIAALGVRALIDFPESRPATLYIMALIVIAFPAVILVSVGIWAALSGLKMWGRSCAMALLAAFLLVMKFNPYLIFEILALFVSAYREPLLLAVFVLALIPAYFLAEHFFINFYLPSGSEIARGDSPTGGAERVRRRSGPTSRPWILACFNEPRAIWRCKQGGPIYLAMSVAFLLGGAVIGFSFGGWRAMAFGALGGLSAGLLIVPLSLLVSGASGALEGTGRPSNFVSYLPVRRDEYTTGRAIGVGLFMLSLLVAVGALLAAIYFMTAPPELMKLVGNPAPWIIRYLATVVPISLGAGAFAIFCRESFPPAAEKMRVSLWGFAAAHAGAATLALTFISCGIVSIFAPLSALYAWLFLALFWSMVFTVFARWGLSNAPAWRIRG